MALEMQAALEAAVLNAIRASLGYTDRDSARTIDARPHPRCGAVWLSVWSDGFRESKQRGALDEVVGVSVSVTVRLSGPFDRWVVHRDDAEARLNAVRALVFKDTLNHSIINAAAALAGLEASNQTDNTKRIGYREALAFTGYDRWQLVPADWFEAKGEKMAGVVQTANFGRARRVQALATMG